MSESVIFDTNLHIKRITKTGVSHETAEAFVETVAHVLEHNLATKADIAGLQKDIAGLQKETAELKKETADIHKDIAVVKQDLSDKTILIIRWNVGTMLAIAGLLLGALKWL